MEIDKKYCLSMELSRDAWEGSPRYEVILDNGLTIYQNDGLCYDNFPDERRYSTWARLRHYCYSEGISIVGMRIGFRTNIINLPTNCVGYYFCKSIMGMLGGSDNIHYYVCGTAKTTDKTDENAIIDCVRWRVPEILETEREERVVKKSDLCLILHKDYR